MLQGISHTRYWKPSLSCRNVVFRSKYVFFYLFDEYMCYISSQNSVSLGVFFFFFFFFFSSNLQTLFSAETFVPMPLIVFTNSSILRINSASHKDWVKYFEFQLLFIFHPYCLYRLFLLSLILGRLFWTSDYCSHVNLPLWILGHMLGEYSEPLFSLIWLTLLDTCCHVVYSFLVSAIFLNFFSIRLIGSHG